MISEPSAPSLERWLWTIFNPGEWTAGGDVEQEMLPWADGIYPVERLLKTLPAKFCINPLKPGSKTRSDANLSARRSFLIEIDHDAEGSLMSEEAQASYIDAIGMPWSTRVWTGGKSLHHVITLDEDLSVEESDALRDRLFGVDLQHRGAIPICDFGVRIKCQVARVPGHLRNDSKYRNQEQALRAVRERIPFAVLDAWLTSKGFPYSMPRLPRLLPARTRLQERDSDWINFGRPLSASSNRFAA